MPTMTASQVFAITNNWLVPFKKKWQHWRATYNYLPPPPAEEDYPADEWALAQAIAAIYDGPVRP